MSTEAEVTEQFSSPPDTEPIYSIHETEGLEFQSETERIDNQHETGEFKQNTKPMASPKSKKAD